MTEKFGLKTSDREKIKTVFSKYPQIKNIILYGSRAKGTYKPGSDIDLTLISTDTSTHFLLKLMNELDDLLLPYKIDLSFYETLDNINLKEHIDRVGVEF